MVPRNTKQGASASGRKASASRGSGSAASRRSATTATSGRSRGTTAQRRTSAAPRKPSQQRSKPQAGPRARKGAVASFSLAAAGRWWLLPAAVAGVVALFVWAYYPVAAVQYRENRARAELAAELQALQDRNARLRGEVERLKTPAGVEDYARSQLGMVKKGENVVVVLDGDEATEASAAAAAPTIDSDEQPRSTTGPWTAFLDLVFGLQ